MENPLFLPLSQCPEVSGTKDATIVVGIETRWENQSERTCSVRTRGYNHAIFHISLAPQFPVGVLVLHFRCCRKY